MKRMEIRTGRVQIMAVAVCCMLAVTMVGAQSAKSAKEAESLQKAGEASKESVRDLLEHLGGMLEQYNALVDGEVKSKKSQSAYKKLTGDLKSTEKQLEGVEKQMTSLNKEAEKFFKAWDKDLATISSDSLRDKSQKRMEGSKAEYAGIGDALGQTGAILAPVVQNLNDQILYMGRDLSPEAMADLKDEAAELNQQAEEATAAVKELLEGAGETGIEAGEAEAGGEAEAEGEPEGDAGAEVEEEEGE